MKKSGCLVLAILAIMFLVVVRIVAWAVYWIFVKPSASDLSLFHDNIIRRHDLYVADPGGSFMARILLISAFSFILWAILVALVELLFRGKHRAGLRDKIHQPLMMLFFGMILYGFIASITIPGSIIKFDKESRRLEITTYGVLAYFIPNPIPEHEFSIPYDDIRSVEAETHDINIRGAEHIMAHLSIETDNHTFVIARKQLYHGEFGWITNWDSREEIHKEGLLEAQEVEKILRKEIGLE